MVDRKKPGSIAAVGGDTFRHVRAVSLWPNLPYKTKHKLLTSYARRDLGMQSRVDRHQFAKIVMYPYDVLIEELSPKAFDRLSLAMYRKRETRHSKTY